MILYFKGYQPNTNLYTWQMCAINLCINLTNLEMQLKHATFHEAANPGSHF